MSLNKLEHIFLKNKSILRTARKANKSHTFFLLVNIAENTLKCTYVSGYISKVLLKVKSINCWMSKNSEKMPFNIQSKLKENTHLIHLEFYVYLLAMKRLSKIEYAIFISLMWSLLQRDPTNQNLFIFTAAGVVPCGGRKTSPRASS